MSRSTWLRHVRRLGWVGFLFFFVKGLAWLAVPAAIAYLGGNP